MTPVSHSGLDADNRSSRDIENDIRERRDKMDNTLGELGSRLTLRALVDSALDWWDPPGSSREGFSSSSSNATRRVVRSLARHVKDHPMPSLLIGGGLAWLIADTDEQEGMRARVHDLAKDGSTQIGESLEHAKEKTVDALDTAKEKIADAGHVVQDKAEHAAHAISDGTKATLDKARRGIAEGYHTGADQFGRAVEESPLGVAVAFAALGALVGLALPHTRKEDELLGEKSDELIEAAKEKGQELLESGKAVGSRVIETVKEEAKEQGITPANLAQGFSEIVQKGTEVVAKAKEEAVHAAKDEGLAPAPDQKSNEPPAPQI